MNALKKIEQIINAVRSRIQQEVSSLIGEELILALKAGALISKADFFNQPLGKIVLAHMDITGEVSGQGALVVSVKDAIRLGGALIMLPPAELEEVASGEKYEGETEDSYGEIANIIAGCYTKVFEEMYPKPCRFVRKEQEVVIPLKVDESSDKPISNIVYYQVVLDMQLDKHQMGTMFMLIPAEPFGLIEGHTSGEINTPPEAQQGSVSLETQDAASSQDLTATDDVNANSMNLVEPESDKDLEKKKKKIDSLLTLCKEKIGEEVGALLGVSVTCSMPENTVVSKEEFFLEAAIGKQVCAKIDVVGDVEDKSYLFISLKDAIRIGGTLIMLPPSELEAAVSEEDFETDSQDAYSEIANIIAGVYTAVFEQQYTKSLRFIKKDISQVVPMKVDISSDEPILNLLYYVSSMTFSMGDIEYGKLQMLFPARLLELEQLGQRKEDDQLSSEKQGLASQTTDTINHSISHTVGAESIVEPADVLVVSDSESDTAMIGAILETGGLSWNKLSFKDNLKKHLPGNYRVVFLVMRRVDEQGVGMAIKISTNCSLPIIAAGPEWTRSKVIRAVKYGVTDILLTPADPADIEDKVKNNILSMAA